MKENIKQTWRLKADQGAMFLANSAPDGYEVLQIERKGTKAVVTYTRKLSA